MPKVIDMLRNTAPMLGAMLTATGPLGAAAGAVLGAVLGTPADADTKTLEKALAAATPDQLLAIKKAEQDFRLQMRQADVQEEAVHAGDRKSARDMHTATGDKTPQFLSYIIVVGVLAYIGAITFLPLETNGTQVAMQVLSYLFGALTTIMAFWFGSSSGSKQKSDDMANLLRNKNS